MATQTTAVSVPTKFADLPVVTATEADDSLLVESPTMGTRRILASNVMLDENAAHTWGGIHTFSNAVSVGLGGQLGNASLTVGVDPGAGLNWVPLRFLVEPAPVLVATPIPGGIESDGTNLFFTGADGVRRQIAFV